MDERISEDQLKIKVLRMLKREFPKSWVWKTSDMWVSGIPDLIVIHKGTHFFIELKTPHGRVAPIQEFTIEQIVNAGGFGYVARSVDDVRDIILGRKEVFKRCKKKN